MSNKIFVADKTTLDNVNSKIDNIMDKLNSITNSSNNSDYIDSIEAKKIDVYEKAEATAIILDISYEKGGILDMYIDTTSDYYFNRIGFYIDGNYSKIPIQDLYKISYNPSTVLLTGIKFKKSLKVEVLKGGPQPYDPLKFRCNVLIKKFA